MRTLEVTEPPEHGADVGELQRLLGLPASGSYDTGTANAVYRKKLALGYLTPDHVAGSLFMAYLTGAKKPTPAMIARAAGRRRAVPKAGSTSRPASHQPTAAERAAAADAAVRAATVSVMHLLLTQSERVHYPAHDIRTMTIFAIATRAKLERVLASGKLSIDCSQAVTLIAHVAGANDPNGGNFRADGFTGTLLTGCAHITHAQARVGDLRVFGGGTGHHVGMVMQPGPDPLLFSHGQERDPIAIRESVEARFQPPGGTFLRLPT